MLYNTLKAVRKQKFGVDSKVANAATVLLNRQIRLLPVVKDGKLVGTVSCADVCRAIVGTL